MRQRDALLWPTPTRTFYYTIAHLNLIGRSCEIGQSDFDVAHLRKR